MTPQDRRSCAVYTEHKAELLSLCSMLKPIVLTGTPLILTAKTKNSEEALGFVFITRLVSDPVKACFTYHSLDSVSKSV